MFSPFRTHVLVSYLIFFFNLSYFILETFNFFRFYIYIYIMFYSAAFFEVLEESG